MKIPHQRIQAAYDSVRRLAVDARAKLGRHAGRLLERYLPAEQQGKSPAVAAVSATPATVPPGRRVYAVGDIHGRADLLIQLLDVIQKDALGGDYRGRPILVFLGDYVDRGAQSREVIDVLLGERMSPFETYFLKGNHEAAMLQFLDEPSAGPRWTEFGGAETLVSYGVRPPRSRTASDEWAMASQEFNRLLPTSHRHFLSSLELSYRLGDYVFVHAGLRPGVELDQQTEYDMLWIRDAFLNDTRPLGAVVVHGHTPTPKPHRDSRRVGIDTGAYLSGRLTAARFEHDAVEFLSTGAGAEAGVAARS